MQDSNLRMHESKSCALPTWLIPSIKLVSAQGFEPRTHALEGRCSIQLSYAPTYIWSGKRDSNSRLQPWQGCALPLNYSRISSSIKSGADEGSRTPTPKALDPKSSASANSATSAYYFFLVEDGGFEPPKAMLTDLQSAPFGHSGNPPYNWSW